MIRTNNIAKGILVLFCSLGAGACHSSGKPHFVAEGVVKGGEGQTLFLEEVGTGNVLSLDSLRLGKGGQFRFSYEGTNYPMFYRLRLGEGRIDFAADSATHIVLATEAQRFFTSYTLSDADPYNHQIREVAMCRHRVDLGIDSLVLLYQRQVITQEEAGRRVDSLVQSFKRHLASHYIYVDPKSPVAFFALFQQKNGGTYFSPQDAGDERVFAAVATAYDSFYPDAPYTPFLKDMALQALAQGKKRRALAQSSDNQGVVGLRAISFPEVHLRNEQGEWQSLTELAEGRTVLLSFTDYGADYSPQHVANLRALKAKRPELFIYEVSVNDDHYLWRNAIRNLPWLCVRDDQGQAVRAYNVQVLPTCFLIEGGKLQRLNVLSEALR